MKASQRPTQLARRRNPAANQEKRAARLIINFSKDPGRQRVALALLEEDSSSLFDFVIEILIDVETG